MPILSDNQTPKDELIKTDFQEQYYEEPDDFPEPYRMSFAGKLLIYCGVWIAVIVIACAVMWNVMAQYEAAQPTAAMNNFIDNSGQSAFYNALLDTYPDTNNVYESVYDIAGKLSVRYGSGMTYSRLTREYTYEKPVYIVSSNGTAIFRVTLGIAEETGFFGFHGYRVESVELINRTLFSLHTLNIIAPKNAVIYISGKPLTAEYITEKTSFGTFGGEEYFTTYSVDGFIDLPHIKVTLDGADLDGKGVWNIVYDYPTAILRTINISAPKNYTVKIDGARVTDKFILYRSASEADIFGGKTEILNYSVNTVYGVGSVSATENGEAFEHTLFGDKFVFSAEPSECAVIVPDGATLFVNGKEADSAFVSDTNADWSTVFAGADNSPTAVEYRFSNLYAIPSFTAEKNGEKLTCETQSANRFVFVENRSDELKNTQSETAIDYVKTYLNYTTQGNSNTRENLDAVLAKTAYPSALYSLLTGSYNGYTYVPPQKMTLSSITADDFIPYGEDAYTCRVSYSAVFENDIGVISEKNSVSLAFVRYGDDFIPVGIAFAEGT